MMGMNTHLLEKYRDEDGVQGDDDDAAQESKVEK